MSFGHNLKSATQHDRDNCNVQRGTWAPCGCSRCHKPTVVFVASYQYFTGRQGRISFAERFLCEEHGRKFGEKYGLTIPDPSIPGERKSASQQRGEFIAAATGADG